MLKFLVRLVLRMCYRFRAYGDDALAAKGPMLLIPNHISWIDWLLLGSVLDDDWKFVTSSVVANRNFLFKFVMAGPRCFPVDPASPYAVRHMSEHLKKGGKLVLFAEGRISPTGALGKLFDGTGFLISNTHTRVVTAYIRGAERSTFAGHPGWKRLFPDISVHFAAPQSPPDLGKLSSKDARRRFTEWVYTMMVDQQFSVEMEFGPRTIVEALELSTENSPKKIALEDALHTSMTYERLMTAAEIMASVAAGRFGAAEKIIGVMLPNVNAFPVVLIALWKLGRVPAILNFSSGPAVVSTCLDLAKIETIITSRAFVENAKIDLQIFGGRKVVYLEELRAEIGTAAKLGTAIARRLGARMIATVTAHDPAVVLFTSGSENLPKGVMLTHENILSNIRQILAATDMEDTDRMFNALPLFHSFGLTVGLLLPLVRGCYTFLYVSPLHYRLVPAVVYDRDCTIMLGTNTFLTGYAQRAHPYDFRKVRYLFAGAEKLQENTFQTWAKRFGVRILEGYGATECSPCISVNTPLAPRSGSAGRFLPGIEHKLEPVEGIEEGGRLFVRGPNVMKGYLNPDADAAFKALGGWYDTGDIVTVDPEGFIFISGRMKRFAKVSGEMVSLTSVEDALDKAFPKFAPRCRIAVVSVKDERKGEALIAVTNEPRLSLDEIRVVLREKGFPNIAVPRDIRIVKEIPRLGSGKTDYRTLQKEIERAG